ncbi:MAG: hypothetical protein ACRDAM_08870, partial [Casimicrobium sp.]
MIAALLGIPGKLTRALARLPTAGRAARIEAITSGTISIANTAFSGSVTLTGWANARTIVIMTGQSNSGGANIDIHHVLTKSASGGDTVLTATRQGSTAIGSVG